MGELVKEVQASERMGAWVGGDVDSNQSEGQNHPCHHLGGDVSQLTTDWHHHPVSHDGQKGITKAV